MQEINKEVTSSAPYPVFRKKIKKNFLKTY